ncbi:hypothetical protein DFH09DRAFT_1073163 [Mycena vulgaris]|nr:hypothetical protein DFH09DRAFT_1073163 [Mycena vulgaris]
MIRLSALRRWLTLAEISRIPNYATQCELAVKHTVYKGDGHGPGGLYITGQIKQPPRMCHQQGDGGQGCAHPDPSLLAQTVPEMCPCDVLHGLEEARAPSTQSEGSAPHHTRLPGSQMPQEASAVEDEVVSVLKAMGQKGIERIELENDLVWIE